MFQEYGIGIKREISTSKIKKIRATRKKCIENGRREDLLGSNPHSKIDDFSRVNKGFILIIKFNLIKINAIIKIVVTNIKIIIQSLSGLNDWKSILLLYNN